MLVRYGMKRFIRAMAREGHLLTGVSLFCNVIFNVYLSTENLVKTPTASSSTSGFWLRTTWIKKRSPNLLKKRIEWLKKRFAISHFFDPCTYKTKGLGAIHVLYPKNVRPDTLKEE